MANIRPLIIFFIRTSNLFVWLFTHACFFIFLIFPSPLYRDDHKLLKWNLVNSECMVITTFPDDFYPTGMHLFPKVSVGGNKHQHDVILVSSADGK